MDQDRRGTMQASAAAAAALALGPVARQAHAFSVPELAAQAFARLDPADKPVRGGTLRLAVSQYIGNMNPNRWPVNDWVSLSYFHEKLMVNDGAYRPTVPYVAESVVRESPTSVLITLRAGIQFHDGSPLTAEAVKSCSSGSRSPTTPPGRWASWPTWTTWRWSRHSSCA